MHKSLAQKLATARALTGLSTRAVSKKLVPRFNVSHATIANYERGESGPPMDLLLGLAELYERPINWFLEKSIGLVGVKYRNLKSRTKSADLMRFEAEAQSWLDAYVSLERRLAKPLADNSLLTRPEFSSKVDPVEASLEVRRRLQISHDEPISSVIEVLERFGVRVIEVPSEVAIDGAAAQYGDEFIVALNPTVSNDRVRLNAAHELAHVLFGDCQSDKPESKIQEKRAFLFASTFLLPNRQLKSAFEGYSMVRLVQFKERFGISLSAMVYRAEQQEIISKQDAKKLWIEFSKRGWRTNEPGAVRPDRATRFEQLLDELIGVGEVSLKEVAAICGVSPSDIRHRLRFAMGLSAALQDGAHFLRFPRE